MTALLVDHRYQSSAWVDSALIKEWFFDVFIPAVKKQLKSKHLPARTVLPLIMLRVVFLRFELKKGNIKTMFLPPHVTPLMQPMDQGVSSG